MSRLVVERSLLRRLGWVAPCVDVVDRLPARRRGWRPISGDAAVAALLADGPPPLVLARSPEVDPGAACLPALAAALGLARVRLPEHPDAAAWCAGLAATWCAAGEDGLARRLHVLGGALARADAGDPTLPLRAWGAEGVRVPALRPAVLARWASWAWRPCRWCAGGGLPGGPCGACGLPVPMAPDRPTGGRLRLASSARSAVTTRGTTDAVASGARAPRVRAVSGSDGAPPAEQRRAQVTPRAGAARLVTSMRIPWMRADLEGHSALDATLPSAGPAPGRVPTPAASASAGPAPHVAGGAGVHPGRLRLAAFTHRAPGRIGRRPCGAGRP